MTIHDTLAIAHTKNPHLRKFDASQVATMFLFCIDPDVRVVLQFMAAMDVLDIAYRPILGVQGGIPLRVFMAMYRDFPATIPWLRKQQRILIVTKNGIVHEQHLDTGKVTDRGAIMAVSAAKAQAAGDHFYDPILKQHYIAC